MNLVCGIIWLVVCVGLAIHVYTRGLRQVKFYRGLVNFCHYLASQIGFALKPLPVIIEQYCTESDSAIKPVLTGYCQLLKNKEDITSAKCKLLCAETDVTDFLLNLGRADSKTELGKINTALQVFTDKKNLAESNLQSKASIMAKLLIIIGIAGVILWI